MNIVIIGGTRGIGKEIAILMSDSADNKVVVAGRNRNSLNEPGGTKFEPFNSRFKAFGRSFNFMKLSNFS